MTKKTPKSIADLLETLRAANKIGADVKFVNAATGETSDDMPDELAEMLAKVGEHCPDCGEVHLDHRGTTGRNVASPELAKRLLDVLQVHVVPPKLIVGQFVRYRKDTEVVKHGGGLHIVVDKIEPPLVPNVDAEAAAGSPIAYRRYDVVLATGSSDTGVCKYLADSRELELYPDADKLLKTNG